MLESIHEAVSRIREHFFEAAFRIDGHIFDLCDVCDVCDRFELLLLHDTKRLLNPNQIKVQIFDNHWSLHDQSGPIHSNQIWVHHF